MQKIKFDFEATKQLIYAPNSTAPIGAPVDADGNVANDGTAIGIVLCRRNENNKYWVKQNLVVMVAGYCDIIDAQEIWGDEYSAEAIAAMSDIVFCDDHKIGGGGGWPADLPKPSVGGYGYTEQGNQTVITWDGDTDGRDSLSISYIGNPTFYRVSDKADGYTDSASIVLSDGTESEEYPCSKINGVGADAYMFGDSFAVIIANAGDFSLFNGNITGSATTSGVYFIKNESFYVESLTYGTPDTVHKIDEKYLPVIAAAPSDDGTYTLTCTVTDGEPAYSWESTT